MKDYQTKQKRIQFQCNTDDPFGATNGFVMGKDVVGCCHVFICRKGKTKTKIFESNKFNLHQHQMVHSSLKDLSMLFRVHSSFHQHSYRFSVDF